MIESIRRPHAFLAAARRAFDAEKPVIMVKLGGSERGKIQARTHTGAVAVDDDVFNAACQRYGIMRCRDIDEMVDFALAFLPARYPAGKRVAVVTTSGGAVGLTLDAVAAAGASLAQFTPESVAEMEALVPDDVDVDNPMDAGSTLAQDVERFCKLGKLFAADPNVDVLAVQMRLPLPGDKITTPEPYIDLRQSTDKPVLGFTRMIHNVDETYRKFQADSGMPFMQGIPATLRAMQGLVTYAERRRKGIPALPEPAGNRQNLGSAALGRALAAFGVTPPSEAVASSPAEAASRAAAIGFPVALKIVSAEISHKTEIGGVRLGLHDEDAVIRAAQDLEKVMAGHDLGGFLVQEMVDGLETIVGVREDEQFGPIVLVGLGGVFVELMRDVSLRLAPVAADEVRDMVNELRGAQAFGEFRGRAARDLDAFANAAAGLATFFLDHRPWLSEIEINPLIVLAAGEGVRAVDIRPVLKQND